MKISNFLGEIRSEMAHVKWPSRRHTIIATAVVIALAVFAAVYLSAADIAFKDAVKIIVTRNNN
jgi:preprotein translocase SecE subunit